MGLPAWVSRVRHAVGPVHKLVAEVSGWISKRNSGWRCAGTYALGPYVATRSAPCILAPAACNVPEDLGTYVNREQRMGRFVCAYGRKVPLRCRAWSAWAGPEDA
ncbi:hypothetical protein GCM10018987_65920 [Streptomyces cremeus]